MSSPHTTLYSIMRSQVDLADDVFDLLFDEYVMVMKSRAYRASLRLDGTKVDLTRDFNNTPYEDVRRGLSSLHKTQAVMNDAALVEKFTDDNFLGSDYRTVLGSPNSPECADRQRIHYSAMTFIGFVMPVLGNAFWKGPGLLRLHTTVEMSEDMPYIRDNDDLCLPALIGMNRIAENFPRVAQGLQDRGHANLSRVAETFAQKSGCIYDLMVDDIERNLATAVAQSDALIKKFSL